MTALAAKLPLHNREAKACVLGCPDRDVAGARGALSVPSALLLGHLGHL